MRIDDSDNHAMMRSLVERFRFDRLTVAMLLAAILDSVTTYYFLSRRLGIELNPILAPLASHSLLWIPVCIVMPKLLVGVMTPPSRQAFASYFLTLCSTFALNNLIGICGGQYFIDIIGYRTVQVAALVVAIACFQRQLHAGCSNRKSRTQAVKIAACWIGVYLLIDGAFLVASRTVTV